MVSFFGLKFGADKKRKEVEALQPPPPPPQWKNDRTEVLLQCSGLLSTNPSRPGTAHSSRSSARRPFAAGENRNSAANSFWDSHDTEFRGVGAGRMGSSASISAGSGPFIPGHGLKSFGSETNLQLSLGARNGSSTSLAAPRLPFGGGGGGFGPRPGSAHSMRNGRERPWMSPLDTSPVNESTPGIAGPQRSPLGQLELMSPVRSDSESLLGEDPEKFARDISDRVTQEEKMARMKTEVEERRRIQAELEATARRNSEASRPKTAGGYPSPPASVTSDYIVPSVLVPGQRSGSLAGAATREARPAGSGRDNSGSRVTPAPGPHTEDSPNSNTRSVRRGRQPSVEGPQPPSRSPLASVAPVVEDRSAIRGRSQTADNLLPASSGSRPHPSREPVRGATVPAVKPQRSPLFQQSSPFDLHKADDGPAENEDGDEQPKIDYRAANAPYGIPSPPLSSRQRTSEEAESRPVIRSVMAKRDTLVVGGPPRQSLGLQIDEFEKTLQQAQTMTALEKGPSASTVSRRTRGDSDGGSSNYSDISESPMTIEPPLVSPKPFPLTPRPTTPSARSNSYSRDILQPSGSTLEPRWETLAGSVGSITPKSGMPANPSREETKDSPAGRPRPTGAMPVKRPTVDEYGNMRVNAVASISDRIRRPSPDEYGIQVKRADSPFRTESPILKEVRNFSSTDISSDGLSSNNTSRSNSPIPSHSHSVFSPPPPAKRPFPSRSATREWDHGPAPTAPPTTPLPIPEKSARRRKAQDTPGRQQQEKATATQSPATMPMSKSPGLASSASIIPDLANNPNWPLPAPSPPASTSVAAEGGFGARRSLLRDKRSAPAPLNIAATRFAEDTGGPWTPDDAASDTRPKTANAERKGSLIRVDTEFEWKEEYSTSSSSRQQQQPAYQVSSQVAAGDSGSKAEAIGMARGLSLKYDQEREQQKRGRAKERMKLMRAWTIDETAAPPTSPTAASPPGQPFDRTMRPNRGLRSPTGIADETGTRFI